MSRIVLTLSATATNLLNMTTESSTRAAALRFIGDQLREGFHTLAELGADGPQEFYTVKEAAQLLRVTDETIYRRVKSGALESVRVGRSVLIPKDAF